MKRTRDGTPGPGRGRGEGWGTRGADLRVPGLFRFVIRFVTPGFILAIFAGSLVKPERAWGATLGSLVDGRG